MYRSRYPRTGDSSRTGTRAFASVLAIAAALVTLPQAGHAQVAPAAQEGDIVVTGSRIPRTDLQASSPVAVVGQEKIALDGNNTLESSLNALPQFQGNTGSTTNAQGGAGVYSADLRGLGPTRTLVLVNGRRFVPADTNLAVDLATIPEALVKRVEVVTGGASAVYGSDAIAGVVNFIMVDSFNGVRLSGDTGITDRGDGFRVKGDLTIGAGLGDRGNVVANFAYSKQNTVLAGDRDFSAVTLNELGDKLIPSGSNNIPGTFLGFSPAVLKSLKGVGQNANCTAATGIRFDQQGAPVVFCDPEDRYNFAPTNLLVRPQVRYQVSVLGHYDVTDTITAFVEGFYIDNTNAYQQAPAAFTAQTARGGILDIPNAATNPALLPATRAFFAANQAVFDPDGNGIYQTINALTRPQELGPRVFNFERKSLNLTGGLRGSLGRLKWEGYYSHQDVDQFAEALNTVSTTRLSQGLDTIIDPTGKVVCRSVIAGCVPVNIFGINALSDAAKAFITPAATARTSLSRDMLGASLAGTLFDNWAGPVGFAVGAEHRREKFTYSPDAIVATGETAGGVPSPAGRGGISVSELFGELRIPLLTDRPFFHDLAVEFAGRYSHYSTIGNAFTYKAGAEWSLTSWLRLRGAYQRAVRAPNLNELYSPQAETFVAGTDPCDRRRSPSTAVKAFCVQQGVPTSAIDTFQAAQIGFNQLSGGNPDLEEEKSNTYTIGAVLSPRFIPRLNITVDYYNISVGRAISSISAQLVVNQCFAALQLSDPFCSRVSRFPNGEINDVQSTLINAAALKVSGIDAQLDYSLALPGLFEVSGKAAKLAIQVAASWQFEDSLVSLPGVAKLDCSGRFGPGCSGAGVPLSASFKAIGSLTYASGPVTLRLQARHIGAIRKLAGITAFRDRFGSETDFDLAARFRVDEHFEFFGGVNNLLDNQPPLMGFRLGGPPNTNEQAYDLLGRRFFFGATMTF
jgi:iron complex outermembrane receptor protein